MFRYSRIALILCIIIPFSGSIALAGKCTKCHVKNDVTVKVPDTAPIRIIVDGGERAVTLKDAFGFHGHECPGVTTAFLALRYGFKLLYGDETPHRNDLLILCRHPAGGVRDMIDYIMKGDDQGTRTWPIAGMKKSREAFKFTIIRKSECLAVEVKLKPALWPKDFFKLKRKQKKKTLTKEEWDTLHTYMANIIMKFPTMTDEELFGSPKPYRTFIWGTLKPGEIDGAIRRMRRSE